MSFQISLMLSVCVIEYDHVLIFDALCVWIVIEYGYVLIFYALFVCVCENVYYDLLIFNEVGCNEVTRERRIEKELMLELVVRRVKMMGWLLNNAEKGMEKHFRKNRQRRQLGKQQEGVVMPGVKAPRNDGNIRVRLIVWIFCWILWCEQRQHSLMCLIYVLLKCFILIQLIIWILFALFSRDIHTL